MKKVNKLKGEKNQSIRINSLLQNKRGDFKMQEMMFVLLAIALLGSLIFIFFIKLQTGNIQAEVVKIEQQRALSLRDKISTLPELKCARQNCIDKDKALLFSRNPTKDLFQGLVSAKIRQIYPEEEEIILYESDNLDQDFTSYSTFTNLCEQQKVGTTFEYNCGLALLVVNI